MAWSRQIICFFALIPSVLNILHPVWYYMCIIWFRTRKWHNHCTLSQVGYTTSIIVIQASRYAHIIDEFVIFLTKMCFPATCVKCLITSKLLRGIIIVSYFSLCKNWPYTEFSIHIYIYPTVRYLYKWVYYPFIRKYYDGK